MSKNIEGQSLFELLFTLVIVAVLVTGVVTLATRSIGTTSFSTNNAQANRYAQEAIEWLREQRDIDFSAFLTNISSDTTSCGTSGSVDYCHCLNSSPLTTWNSGVCSISTLPENIDNLFFREVNFECFNSGNMSSPLVCTNATVDVVDIDVSVSWNDSQGSHVVRTSTRLSNWRRF